jgi:hypothetical protein
MTEISEAAKLVRQMYADGATIDAIRKATKVKLDRIYYWVDGGNGRLPPLPRRRLLGHGFGKRSMRAAMIARLMRAAEQQLRKVEQQLAIPGLEPAESERNNRALAVIAPTMREVTALDAFHRSQELLRGKTEPNYEHVPRNIDELRDPLLRKLETLIAERESGVSEPPDG